MSISSLGIVFDPFMLNHAANSDVETEFRLSYVYKTLLDNSYIGTQFGQFKPIRSRPATMEEIALCHSMSYLESLQRTASSQEERDLVEDLDQTGSIALNEHSWECAVLAAGSVVSLADALVAGQIQRGVALVRPPGHHACVDRPMGFCLLGNVAIAAKSLVQRGERVLIVDWDIHHGNGTQELVFNVPGVMFYSIHRYDCGKFYPRTGEPGEYFNIKNVGFSKPATSVHDNDYIYEFTQIPVWLSNCDFKPTVILVSAGFDAAEGDPIGGYQLTPECYATLTQQLLKICPRLLLILEGGYNPKSVTNSLIACMDRLITT